MQRRLRRKVRMLLEDTNLLLVAFHTLFVADHLGMVENVRLKRLRLTVTGPQQAGNEKHAEIDS